MDFSSIKKCTELRGEHIAAAVQSSEAMRELLARFEAIAAPGKGAPVVLAALARLGTTACGWIDGELRIELTEPTSQPGKTILSVTSTIGGGFREKVFTDSVFAVPIAEFKRSVSLAPRLVEPLRMRETDKKIVLSATAEARMTSMPPPMIEIDTSCLLLNVPKHAVPLRIETLPPPSIPIDEGSGLFDLDPPSAGGPEPALALRPKVSEKPAPRVPRPAPRPVSITKKSDPKVGGKTSEPKIVLRKRVRPEGVKK